jgi:hypothetical protein
VLSDFMTSSAFGFVALAVPLLHYGFLWSRRSGPIPIRLDDDAFYYLTIARNIAAGLGSTFDGLGPTNGYHPIWLGLLIPLAAVAPSDDWLIGSVYVLNSLLWIASVMLLAALGRSMGCRREMVFALPVLIWYGATWGGRGHYLFFTGLEIGLTIVLLLLIVWRALAIDLYGKAVRWQSLIGLGALLGLLVLTRLDTVFIAAVLIGLLALNSARLKGSLTRGIAAALHLAAPVGLALGLYVAFNLAVAGTPLAISGQAKSLHAPWFSSINLLLVLGHGFFYKLPIMSGLFLLPLSVTTALRLPQGQKRHRTWRFIVIGLALSFLVQVLVWWSLYIPHGIRAYYFYVTPVVALIAVPPLISHLEARVCIPRLPSLVLSICFTGVLTLRLLLSSGWTGAHEVESQSFLDHSRQVSEWLKNNTPPGTRYAMADRSGVMGFLLRRPIFSARRSSQHTQLLERHGRRFGRHRILLDRGIMIFIRSEPGELPHDSVNCVVAPVFGGDWSQPHFRLCPEDLLWRSENRDSIVTVWRLQRRPRTEQGSVRR